MARIRLDLDSETYQRLVEVALAERRPVPWQAEIMLRVALGLPFPYPDVIDVTPTEPIQRELASAL
jgi:hypothetical protein